MKKISQKGIDLIKSFEGLELKAYLCPAKVWTIGYGHTKGVRQGQSITSEQADDFLKSDIADSEKEVNKQSLKLNQNQFDALVSFTYNVGVGSFRSSTLLKKAKRNPNDESIRNEFAKWKYANSEILPGLIRRRTAESDLYFS